MVILASYIFTKIYQDRYESEAFITFVTTLAITLGFLTMILIPVDIYNVSSTVNTKTGIRNPGITEQIIMDRNKIIRDFYYVLYCAMFVFSFAIAPFAYFFYEEGNDVPLKSRIWAGFKYTIFLILIIIVLLVIGLFIDSAGKINTNDTNAKDFIENLFDFQNSKKKFFFFFFFFENNFFFSFQIILGGQAAIEFALSCLALLGYILWISYAAYGFSAFPFAFLKRSKRTDEEKEELQSEIIVSRERKNLLKQKYLSGRMSNKDKKRISDLEDKEQ